MQPPAQPLSGCTNSHDSTKDVHTITTTRIAPTAPNANGTSTWHSKRSGGLYACFIESGISALYSVPEAAEPAPPPPLRLRFEVMCL